MCRARARACTGSPITSGWHCPPHAHPRTITHIHVHTHHRTHHLPFHTIHTPPTHHRTSPSPRSRMPHACQNFLAFICVAEMALYLRRVLHVRVKKKKKETPPPPLGPKSPAIVASHLLPSKHVHHSSPRIFFKRTSQMSVWDITPMGLCLESTTHIRWWWLSFNFERMVANESCSWQASTH